MIEWYLKAEGPIEEKLMSLFDELKAVLSDTTNLSNEAVEIRTAVEAFKQNASELSATIQQLRAELANGNGISDSQLAELLTLAKAKDEAIAGLFTPDPVEPAPTVPAESGE